VERLARAVLSGGEFGLGLRVAGPRENREVVAPPRLQVALTLDCIESEGGLREGK